MFEFHFGKEGRNKGRNKGKGRKERRKMKEGRPTIDTQLTSLNNK